MAPETTRQERGPTAREQGDEAVVVDAARHPPVAATFGARDWSRAVRTERALLQTRIEVLERTVEHKDRRLQEVVDRYEQVMAERDRERRAAANRTVGEVEIEFEDEQQANRVERVGRWVRAALDRLRR
jgi:hypothetical protein